MYIPEFVCGVVVTLAVEMAGLFIGSVIVYSRKSGKR